MPALPQKKKFTPEEYPALEEKAEFRSEYERGEIVAMAGASLDHQQIIANLTEFLGSKIRGKRRRALPSEMKIYVEANQKFYYPDATIICEKPKFYKSRNDTIVNPKLFVEVLSKKTEAKDRGEKFFAYQTLASVEEYVLVSQDRHLVEQFIKQTDGSWKYPATIGNAGKIYFETLQTELSLRDIYDLVEFETKV